MPPKVVTVSDTIKLSQMLDASWMILQNGKPIMMRNRNGKRDFVRFGSIENAFRWLKDMSDN